MAGVLVYVVKWKDGQLPCKKSPDGYGGLHGCLYRKQLRCLTWLLKHPDTKRISFPNCKTGLLHLSNFDSRAKTLLCVVYIIRC